MNEKQYDELSDALLKLAGGSFNVDLSPRGDSDEIDSLRIGIKMLGEALADSTVSLDYFLNIYNSVDSMVFVVDKAGYVIEANEKALDTLGFLVTDEDPLLFTEVTRASKNLLKKLEKLGKEQKSIQTEMNFTSKDGLAFPVVCNCSVIKDVPKRIDGYLIVANDDSARQAYEKTILRKIVETQDGEQSRIAKDLHDGLGQELSLMKTLLSSIKTEMPQTDKMLNACMIQLDNCVKEIQIISFNMMPTVLEKYGLIPALDQLFFMNENKMSIKFKFNNEAEQINLTNEQEVAIYRITQEFLNNSLKYSNAENISINIAEKEGKYHFTLSDDGVGFDMEANKTRGNGISNIYSRVKAYNWEVDYKSKVGKGTCLTIKVV